ncbi:MAG: RiPP maturation radical SAM C-methyltransferase [Candidatus Aminicenantes bacterium]|jgi:ribosomal peptide maturation radical SAM protein 1
MLLKEAEREARQIPLHEILQPADVLLVVSPTAQFTVPSLGIHLLEASCRDAGINTTVLYSNLLYLNLIGAKLHTDISRDGYLLLGERIFASAAFNLPSVSIGRSMQKFSDPAWWPDHLWHVNRHDQDPQVPIPVVPFREWLATVDLEDLESSTANWLHALACQIVNLGYRIVGGSTTLGGLVPAVALLNCIKKADPDVITIIGGALCEAEMAEGILSLKTGIDYIFSGEGEITFPALARQILGDCLPKEKIITGADVTDLDHTPLPDYRNYIEQREKLHPQWPLDKYRYMIPFESSRGCWHGKCTFCGLNGQKNLFRCKSPDVIIQNLKALVNKNHMNEILMSDNMMPLRYFDTLIPRLSTEIPSIKIVYEMKADLTLDQVLSLKEAGITFRPGIESLAPSLLRRMHKPYTVRENIALLRYCRSAGITLDWNLLFGFPGDQISEYEEMLHLLPLIRHLQPPMNMLPLALIRFGNYQVSPGAFGISNLRPAEVHRDTLPLHADLDKITYLFSADFSSQSRENPEIITALWKEYRVWSQAWAVYKAIPLETLLPTLHLVRKSNELYVLEDTRQLPGQPKRREINRYQAGLLLVARPLETVPDVEAHWVVDAGLGVVMESWLIPLTTAEPVLLQEFEREYEQDV